MEKFELINFKIYFIFIESGKIPRNRNKYCEEIRYEEKRT